MALSIYRRNIQGSGISGDITHIFDMGGNLVAKYVYDAWGCHKVLNPNGTENTDPAFIGNINPFRYRGYYYDTCAGLYYLNSRYYDPIVGRFISADDISELQPNQINGLNLYAYCLNNPVMFSDSTGRGPIWDWIKGAANTVGNWVSDHWKEILIGAAFILVGALVTALTAGTGIGFLAAFGGALLSSLGQVAISMAISVVIGGIVSVATGGGFFDNFGNSLASGFMWGGIFAGGAQILSGGFKAMAQMGASTSKSGSFIKVLTPNRLRSASEVAKIAQKGQAFYEYGGTLLKVGKVFIDISNKTFLHMHLFTAAHIQLGTILAGIIGGFK